MDLLGAHRVVKETHQQLKNYVRDFDTVKKTTDNFVNWANARFQSEESEMEVQGALPAKHTKKEKVCQGSLVMQRGHRYRLIGGL